MTGNDIRGVAFYRDGVGLGVVIGPFRFFRRVAHARCISVNLFRSRWYRSWPR